MVLKYLAVLGLSACVLMMLPGCVEFANGVVEKPLPNDERLIGYWDLDQTKDPASILIESETDRSISITILEERRCDKAAHGSATRTQIDSRNFLDIVIPQEGGTSLIFPVEYDLTSPDQLRLMSFDVEAAIENAELAGEIEKNGNWPDTIKVTASTHELRSWIAGHRPHPYLLVDRRDPASAPPCSRASKLDR